MNALKNIGNVMLIAGMSAAFVVLMGWLARTYQLLFCFGYGC